MPRIFLSAPAVQGSMHFEALSRLDEPRRILKILNPNGVVGASHRHKIMNAISNSQPTTFESTYALIVRSEEKHRSRFETLIYALLTASAIFAVSQFSRQIARTPLGIAHNSTIPSASVQHRV
jgi:hypothetical protein